MRLFEKRSKEDDGFIQRSSTRSHFTLKDSFIVSSLVIQIPSIILTLIALYFIIIFTDPLGFIPSKDVFTMTNSNIILAYGATMAFSTCVMCIAIMWFNVFIFGKFSLMNNNVTQLTERVNNLILSIEDLTNSVDTHIKKFDIAKLQQQKPQLQPQPTSQSQPTTKQRSFVQPQVKEQKFKNEIDDSDIIASLSDGEEEKEEENIEEEQEEESEEPQPVRVPQPKIVKVSQKPATTAPASATAAPAVVPKAPKIRLPLDPKKKREGKIIKE